MKIFNYLYLLLLLGTQSVIASTSYGTLNNFDTVNDTGGECRGFEIEIDGAHSTDVTYTYNWNHYGAPQITEDKSDPNNPKVFIRYTSPKNPDGTWSVNAYTSVPTQVLSPTNGHFCTNPTNYSYGCEHFGVGYYGNPTSVRYHWMVIDGTNNLVLGPSVNVATPKWTYVPPVLAQPAQVVAVIPAPVVPIPVNKAFGDPAWIKVIKTTTHNTNSIELANLVSADDANGKSKWQNGEPAQVETEWYMLQTNTGVNPAKTELTGQADIMGDGSEKVTRRYEFYKYAAGIDTIDGETGEAMCDAVNLTTDPTNPGYLHGVGNNIAVTDASGVTQYVDCSSKIVVGDYVGAQMAGFDAGAPLGIADNIPDGVSGLAYVARTIIIGGNTPYKINIVEGNLPPSMNIGDYVDLQTSITTHGVLAGTPTSGGTFNFTISATDANGVVVTKAYIMNVSGVSTVYQISVTKSGSGTGRVTGNGVDCGATCAVLLSAGTVATLNAVPDANSIFSGWSGDADCTDGSITVDANKICTATFNLTYTVTPSVNKGGSITPNTPQKVSAGNSLNFTVTPNKGYVRIPKNPSGDCPQGSWLGNIWTTGAINANCAIKFGFFCFSCLPDSGGWRASIIR